MAGTTGMRRTILLLTLVDAAVLLASGVVLAQTSSPYTYVSQWGGSGSEDGKFNFPAGVATDSSGNVYVSDYGNDRIQNFDSNGTFVRKVSAANPNGVAAGSSGLVYVTNYDNSRLEIYVPDWSGHMEVGGPGTGPGLFKNPNGVAIDSSGNIYVADSGNNRIQKFSPQNVFVRQWGKTDLTTGNGNGEFNGPVGVATDSSNNVYVSDQGNNRIQKFDTDGNFKGEWGGYGSEDGKFDFPVGVATDSSGNVYVSDYGNDRIQKFSSSGAFLAKWGSPGSGNGEFNNPAGMAIDSSGNVYVDDSGNNRIQKFAPLNTPPNSAPTAKDDPTTAGDSKYSVDQDGSLTVSASDGVLANDTDPEKDTLTAVKVSDPAHASTGGFTFNSDGSFTYTPSAGFSGTDSFTYKANDGSLDSTVATVTLTVNPAPVNTAPVAEGQLVTTDAATAQTITLKGSDADGNDLTFAIDNSGLSHGSLGSIGAVTCGATPNTCTEDVTYTPTSSGTDSFTFKVNDGTVDSSTATVNITVNPGATSSPMVKSVAPGKDATGVSRSTTVTANFDVAMKASSLANPKTQKSTTFILTGPGKRPGSTTQVSAKVTCNNSCTTATLTPSKPLAANTTYTATVKSEVEDTSGKKLGSDEIWSFRTGG